MSRGEVVELLTFAQALIHSYRLPIERKALDLEIEVWYRQLGDLPADLVTATLEAAAASEDREFVLNAPQLRLRATTHLAGRPPSIDEAWGEVKDQIRRAGWCGSPVFTHASIALVVERFTWLSLCESVNEVADRAHFVRLYQARVNEDRERVAVPPAARAVLDAYAPPALEVGHRVHAIAPVDVVVDEPRHLLDPEAAKARLTQEIAAIRDKRDGERDDERTKPVGSSITKWQEGDPIDLEARGIEPEPPADVDQAEVSG